MHFTRAGSALIASLIKERYCVVVEESPHKYIQTKIHVIDKLSKAVTVGETNRRIDHDHDDDADNDDVLGSTEVESLQQE